MGVTCTSGIGGVGGSVGTEAHTRGKQSGPAQNQAREEPFVELELDEEDHNDLGKEEHNEEINVGGEVCGEKNDEENATQHKGRDNQHTQTKDKPLGIGYTPGGDLEKGIGRVKEHCTQDESEEDEDALVGD